MKKALRLLLVIQMMSASWSYGQTTLNNKELNMKQSGKGTKELADSNPQDEASSNMEIVKQYFTSVSSRDTGKINALFSKDVDIYFPHAGVLKGIEGLEKANEDMIASIKILNFDMDKFIYTQAGNRVVVEGIESGQYTNGKTFTDKRFCSVFEIHGNLITRMYTYPNLYF